MNKKYMVTCYETLLFGTCKLKQQKSDCKLQNKINLTI